MFQLHSIASRPALEPTQSPIEWYQGQYIDQDTKLIAHFHLVLRLGIHGASPPCIFLAWRLMNLVQRLYLYFNISLEGLRITMEYFG